jgi:integrase
MTFAEAAALFIERWSKPRCQSWARIDEILQRKFPTLMQRPVVRITRSNMAEAVAAISAPMMTNRALATVRKMFSWLEQRGIIEEHPCIRMPLPAKENPRERVLTGDEIVRVWHAAEVLGPIGAPYYRMPMLRAQRRGETSRMRWANIADGVWSIPGKDTKNGKGHTVHLPTQALALIYGTARCENCPFVSSHDGVGPIANQARMKVLLDRASGVTDRVSHDVRRSVVSHLAGLGVAPHILEKIINHQSGVIS